MTAEDSDVGEMDVGEMDVGEMDVGEMDTDDMDTDDMDTDDMDGGDSGVQGKRAADGGLAAAASAALTAFRAGDHQPLGDLVREVSPILWHTVRAQGVDRDRAEDVVQGVWLALVRNAEAIRDPGAVLQWLLVSARRAAWESVRRHRQEDRRAGATTILGRTDGLATTTGSDELVLVAERDRMLWLAFRRLSARCQEILRMVAVADRPDYRAIATATGMPVSSVGVTRGRCLAKLRAMLQSDETWVGG